jgi:hypothetical protein
MDIWIVLSTFESLRARLIIFDLTTFWFSSAVADWALWIPYQPKAVIMSSRADWTERTRMNF